MQGLERQAFLADLHLKALCIKTTQDTVPADSIQGGLGAERLHRQVCQQGILHTKRSLLSPSQHASEVVRTSADISVMGVILGCSDSSISDVQATVYCDWV